jgi:hypothetical protein
MEWSASGLISQRCAAQISASTLTILIKDFVALSVLGKDHFPPNPFQFIYYLILLPVTEHSYFIAS